MAGLQLQSIPGEFRITIYWSVICTYVAQWALGLASAFSFNIIIHLTEFKVDTR